jgi:hypothetical protein
MDVISPGVSRLHLSLVSLFVSSLAVTGLVSFDAGFNPHTERHCSLLETSTNFELAVCSYDPFRDKHNHHCCETSDDVQVNEELVQHGGESP